MDRRIAEVGDVYAVPKRGGGTWTICQVVSEPSSAGDVRVCAFDWLGDHLPDIEELRGTAPLRSGLALVDVFDRLPPRRFVHLGSASPLGEVPEWPVYLGGFMRFGEELAGAVHPLWRMCSAVVSPALTG